MEHEYIASASQIFTLFFIMLGPLRVLGPFAKESKSLSQNEINTISWKSTMIAAVLLIICGLIGKELLEKWHIPVAILELTTGVIFAYVALFMILAPKKDAPAPGTAVALTPVGTAIGLLITPYGAAALIAFLALSQDSERTLTILTALVAVLAFDWLAMVLIRKIMTDVGVMVLKMVGVVLGVLQAALALTIIHNSLQRLAVVALSQH